MRARRVFAVCAAGAAVVLACLLLAASRLLATTAAYPNARLVFDEGLVLLGQCPTYGARVGSVRSPLCSWRVTRRDWFETEDAMVDVYHWYETRGRLWSFDFGRLHALLKLDEVQPAAPVNALTRFGVETGLSIDVAQP